MKLRKLLTIGLLSSQLLNPLVAFAETKTKDITNQDFLAFVEQLKNNNPKLEIVEDAPVTVHTVEEAKQREDEQKVQLETTNTEVNAKLAEYAQKKKEYDEAVEKYKQDKITYDELWTIYSAQKAQYDADVAHNEELKQENQRMTDEYNAKKQQYDTDLAAYNQRNQEITDATNRNETKKTNWQNDVARITASNKQIKDNYDKQVADAKKAHQHLVDVYEQENTEYEDFIANNPKIIDLSDEGLVLRGVYDDAYKSHDKGENTPYKNWWIAANQSAIMRTLPPAQMDFHNYGGADPIKYFANVYTMYDKDKLEELGYDYSLGNIGINSNTTMNVTYRDPRVTDYTDSYGHNYKISGTGVVDNFLKFDLHNLGTTESGKTISAHVSVSKWKADFPSATWTYQNTMLGGFGEEVRAKYDFYDESTGQPIKLVRMFEMIDMEAGESMRIESNDKVKMVVPIAPSDVSAGVQEGTHGYNSVTNATESGATLVGNQTLANANFTVMANQPTTLDGKNDSTPLAMGIGAFTGSSLTASWSGAGGGISLNTKYVRFKEPPTPPANFDVTAIPTPHYEDVPAEPTYETVPTPLAQPVAPEAPTLHPIVTPTAPTEPSMASPVAPTNAPAEVSTVRVRYKRTLIVQYDTNWVDEDGNVLKDKVTDNTTKEHGDIDNYAFVKSTTDEDGNVTHIFRQYTTKWVDEDGKELKTPVKGSKTVEIGDVIPEYYYVKTEKDDKGNVTYVYRQVKTSYVKDTDRSELSPTEKGTHPEKPIYDYSYTKTETDDKGNVTHIYRLLHTIFVDEDGHEISPKEDGQKNQKPISGYVYRNTEPNISEGIIKHIYRQVSTSWKTVDGTTLKPTEKGVQDSGSFTGYRLVRTETTQDGDVVHVFEKKNDVPTGVTSDSRLFLGLGGLSLLGLGSLFAKKKKRDNE